jgi:nitrate reductase gamma subunit
MEGWLVWARGPGFRFALLLMLLGLLRQLLLTVLALRGAVLRAADRNIPYRKVFLETLGWMVPLGRLREQFVLSLLSILFHVGLILVPVFLAGHIVLWRRGLGVGWPALPNSLADVLTLVTLVTCLGLILARTSTRESRALSRGGDYVLLVVLAAPFASGYLVMHPAMNPFDPTATLLVHVLAAELVMVLLPLTKLTHCILLPANRLVSDVGWHFPPEAGEEVLATLETEQERTC